MSKRFTKIICTAVAAISAASLAFAPACAANWSGVAEKDNSAYVEGTNGGFVAETGDYVYFVNGKAVNTEENKFGSAVKGAIKRIKKTELNAGNLAKCETVVPSVYYSGNYNAGLYIYDGYIYYTTPTTEKNTDGEVLNSNLDFKRTKLDGTDTTNGYIWQSSDNAVDYRFVKVGDTVYILYALSENLYGTSVTNVHSVNCTTKENVILAYNVTDYAFDTEDPENPYVYYTMNVPQFLGESTNYGYNQLYRVRADVAQSPRSYDFSEIEDYDAEKDPVYINYGDYVFDGIGWLNYKSGRVSQLNFAYGSDKEYVFDNADYTYDIQWYRDGVLYYTRKSSESGSLTSLFKLSLSDVDKDNDGRVDASWDAIDENKKQADPAVKNLLVRGSDTTEYEFCEIGGETYAINAGSDGITKSLVKNEVVEQGFAMTADASATILDIREEHGHLNLYYSATGGNGYTINRIAIDGTEDDYRKLSPSLEPDLTYRSVKVLDLDACSDWFKPEFVGNKLFFASETAAMTEYNYIMVCDLTGADGVMTNEEIDAYNEKYEGVTEKIEAYDSETNADGTAAYDGLSKALKYVYYTGDTAYIDELIQAYIDIQDKDKEYAYSEASVKIFKDFPTADGDWADYKDDYKEINGKKVYANSRDYYYTLIGEMKESDAEAIASYFKTEYMKEYPVDDSTWYEKLSTGGKVGFIIGMCAAGLLVIGGAVWLTIFLVKRKKNGGDTGSEKAFKVDITDDRSVDVYGDENGDGGKEEN